MIKIPLYLAAALTAASSHAATIITTDADTFVQGSSGNFGTSESLVVKRSSAGPGSQYTRTTWIHFDTSSIINIASATDASFSLVVNGGGTNITSGTISLWGIVQGAAGDEYGTDWTETTITGGNDPQSPDFTDGANTKLLGTLNLSSLNTANGSVHVFDSAELLSFLQSDTNGEVTLILTRNLNDNNFAYYSRENTAGMDAPSLSITAIPEPSTSTLFLSCGALLLFRRRK